MPPDVPPTRRRWFLGLVALLIAGVTAYAGRTLVRPAPRPTSAGAVETLLAESPTQYSPPGAGAPATMCTGMYLPGR